jgi:hypothetical protein
LEEYEDTWFGIGFNPGEPTEESVWGVPLIVRNAAGRKTAYGVQVLATFGVKAARDESWIDYVIDQPLVWKFSNLPSPGGGTAAVDIPPGVGKKVFFAFIGEANQLHKTLWPQESLPGGFANDAGEQIAYNDVGGATPSSPPIAGVLATYPFTQEAAFWFWRDVEYRLRLTLTSHDSDAVTYEALVSFPYSEQDGKQAALKGRGYICPNWPSPDWLAKPISREPTAH